MSLHLKADTCVPLKKLHRKIVLQNHRNFMKFANRATILNDTLYFLGKVARSFFVVCNIADRRVNEKQNLETIIIENYN